MGKVSQTFPDLSVQAVLIKIDIQARSDHITLYLLVLFVFGNSSEKVWKIRSFPIFLCGFSDCGNGSFSAIGDDNRSDMFGNSSNWFNSVRACRT